MRTTQFNLSFCEGETVGGTPSPKLLCLLQVLFFLKNLLSTRFDRKIFGAILEEL